MSNQNFEQPKKFAVLIDADNASHAHIEVILEEIAKYGTISVKRIYGDWGVESLKKWQDKLLPLAITPVQQFAYVKGKDATDMKLVIDTMDLLYAGAIDGFCIVSSDSDFTPLVSRIRESGRLAYGFGRKNTVSSFISACDKFVYVENLTQVEEKINNEKEKTETESNTSIEIEPQTLQLIYKAIADSANDDGWADLGQVGQYISIVKSDFDCRTYGSATLSKLLKKLAVFEVKIKNTKGFVKKFNFEQFIKYINNLIENIDKENQGVKISTVIEHILNDKNCKYNVFSEKELEDKIKAIHSKHFDISVEKNSIRKTV